MFVASLNLDIFFKKVFSNKKIAKKFLEDFFGVKITEIKLLATDHKVTDDATLIRFDYRCKINGQYVVIEMQQKYKTDVNKRFYLYHCLGTALQLETLKPKVVTQFDGKTYTEKNYGDLEPVITLIWMVDDTLNFTDDFIAFTTLPEAAKDFIANNKVWEQPLEAILEERQKTLNILNNDTKNLDFFSKNKIIYAFQRNIVKNKRISKYFRWFDLADKSRKVDNVEEDFSQFKNDDIMAEVIKRIRKDRLAPQEHKFISDMPLYEAYYRNLQIESDEKMLVIENKLKEKLKEKEKKLLEKDNKLLEKDNKLLEKDNKLQIEHQKLLQGIENLRRRGDSIESIADLLVRTVEEITAFIAEIEQKKD